MAALASGALLRRLKSLRLHRQLNSIQAVKLGAANQPRLFSCFQLSIALCCRTMKRLFSCTSICILALLLVAVPAFAQAARTDTAPTCTLSALLNSVTATTEIVAAPSASTTAVFINGVSTSVSKAKAIQICSVNVLVNQAVGAADFGLIYGTGTNCGTGGTNLTPQWVGTASVKETWAFSGSSSDVIAAPAGKAVCLKLSAAPTKAQVLITYRLL
jgi:hypothetical protein